MGPKEGKGARARNSPAFTFAAVAALALAIGANTAIFSVVNNWRRQTSAFQDVSAYRFGVVNLTEGEPEQVATAHVSADVFRLALIGVWLPARRAARVDPVVALRTD